ncbi:MAG: hypothetical protein ACE5LU_12785, partial [Anaerolineae bacterium]
MWVVFDPVNKLVLAILIGERETEQAVGVLSRFKACLVAGCLPVLTSDQLPHYAQAIPSASSGQACRSLGVGCSRSAKATAVRIPNPAWNR